MSQAPTMQRKMTVKGILGAKVDTLEVIEKLIAAKSAKPVPLCRIIGRANKAKPDTSKLGDFVRFGGEFIGVNLLTGERSVSGSAILPGIAESAVYGQMANLNDKGQAETTVEFAFEIGAKFDATAATKYVYTVLPLLDVKTSDPMTALLAKTEGAAQLTDKSKK